MKVTAFLGSPRKDGNTEILLTAALDGIREQGHDVRLFNLNLMNFRPCQNCGGCDDTGICVFRDDMDGIYEAIREADRVILASPIFFFGLSAQAKAMIDRCQSFWCEKYLLKKPMPPGRYGRKGLLLLVGGMKKEEGCKCSEVTAKAFFRTISVPEHISLCFLGVDAKGSVTGHPTALKDASEAGRKLVAMP